MNETQRRIFKQLHYPVEVILTCACWYVVYPLSLRQLHGITAESGVAVDHFTIYWSAIKMLLALTAVCSRRKRPVEVPAPSGRQDRRNR